MFFFCCTCGVLIYRIHHKKTNAAFEKWKKAYYDTKIDFQRRAAANNGDSTYDIKCNEILCCARACAYAHNLKQRVRVPWRTYVPDIRGPWPQGAAALGDPGPTLGSPRARRRRIGGGVSVRPRSPCTRGVTGGVKGRGRGGHHGAHAPHARSRALDPPACACNTRIRH